MRRTTLQDVVAGPAAEQDSEAQRSGRTARPDEENSVEFVLVEFVLVEFVGWKVGLFK